MKSSSARTATEAQEMKKELNVLALKLQPNR